MAFATDDGVDGAGLRTAIRTITATWTSDSATGAVSGLTPKICGRLLKVTTIPGTGGVQPSSNYTVTVTDQNFLTGGTTGVDVLGNCSKTCAANQSNLAQPET